MFVSCVYKKWKQVIFLFQICKLYPFQLTARLFHIISIKCAKIACYDPPWMLWQRYSVIYRFACWNGVKSLQSDCLKDFSISLSIPFCSIRARVDGIVPSIKLVWSKCTYSSKITYVPDVLSHIHHEEVRAKMASFPLFHSPCLSIALRKPLLQCAVVHLSYNVNFSQTELNAATKLATVLLNFQIYNIKLIVIFLFRYLPII